MARLEFWFDFASTYSYPAALRVEALAQEAGVALDWRPFLLGPVFAAAGLRDSPFNANPTRGRYMWRDLERICERHGLPWQRPPHFPAHSVLAANVALVALEQPWGPDFVRAVFRANFAEGRDIASPEVLGGLLAALGQEPGAVLAQAQAPAHKGRLRAQTQEAMGRGYFGAPTFWVEGELFFGQDRLLEALEWARRPAG